MRYYQTTSGLLSLLLLVDFASSFLSSSKTRTKTTTITTSTVVNVRQPKAVAAAVFFSSTRSSSPSSFSSLQLIPIRNYLEDLSFLSHPDDNDDDETFGAIDREGRFYLVASDDLSSPSTQQTQTQTITKPYELCLVEERDLPDLSQFIVRVFGADVIRLSSDLNTLERTLMEPAVGWINGYSTIVAFVQVLSGLQSRLADRFQPPPPPQQQQQQQQEHEPNNNNNNNNQNNNYSNMDLSPPNLQGLSSRAEKIDAAARKSLVLALAKQSKDSDRHIDVVATVELRLQPCDAKIPFSFPWLDRLERRLASALGIPRHDDGDGDDDDDDDEARDILQPYLSNLCVDERCRGKRLGKALVRCVEDIARNVWGYHRMYLHVDLENVPACNLYKREGYRDVGLRWNPFWAGHASDIAYFVKNLKE